MKQLYKEDPSLTEEELRDICEFNGTFNDAQKQLDDTFNLGDLLTSLLIGQTILDLLPDGTNLNDVIDLPDKINLPDDFTLPTQSEIDQYQQLLDELNQYGRIEDPETQEYKYWQWQQDIADKIGSFGDLESQKQGDLDLYKGQQVMIPWVTAGDDNVCEDCAELEANGPYPPDEFPEPPHYGCRCNDPMADPVITSPEDVEPTKEELDALAEYNMQDDPAVNEYLRNNEVPSDYLGTEQDIIDQIKAMDDIIDRNTFNEDKTLYRGVDGVFDDKVIGDNISDNAYWSTTTDFEQATEFGDTVFEIQIQEGYNGINLDDILSEQIDAGNYEKLDGLRLNEEENLLRRGSNFDVIDQYIRESEWGDKINVLVLRPGE